MILFQEVANKDPQAKCNLGYCYLQGKGVPQDYAKAVKLFQESAQDGCVSAITHLAICYLDGKGVQKDVLKAIDLIEEAAMQGDPEAIQVIAGMGL